MGRFNISRATTYRDFDLAVDDLVKVTVERLEHLIGRSVGLMAGIIRKAIARKDFMVVIRACQHLDRVLGLTNRLEVKGKLQKRTNRLFKGI
jgi:hypothetical protein